MISDPDPTAVLGEVLLDQEFSEGDLRSVRNAATAHADHLGLDAGLIGDLELIVSELASNAIRHGGGRGRIRLWSTATELVCEVSDQGPGLPGLPPLRPRPDPASSGGRGLWLILTYADQVDVHTPPGGGTAITATLHHYRPAPAS
jgi:anti-sigma regulatory factor (Ser/Thr protein kinase)